MLPLGEESSLQLKLCLMSMASPYLDNDLSYRFTFYTIVGSYTKERHIVLQALQRVKQSSLKMTGVFLLRVLVMWVPGLPN